jgi:diacylglycerol kinase family enzyme
MLERIILINANAGNVNKKVIDKYLAYQKLDNTEVFVSDSKEKAKKTYKFIIENGCKLAIPVGGDGTFQNMLNGLREEGLKHSGWQEPIYGIPKNGTGNAVATYISSDPEILLNENINKLDTKELPLMKIKAGEHEIDTFLVGCGWDGAIIENFDDLRKIKMWRKTHGLVSYLAACGKTALEELFKTNKKIEITNNGIAHGKKSYEIDSIIESGHHIHMIAAGTIPNYGFDFKAFPNAEIAGKNKLFQASVISGPKSSVIFDLINNGYNIGKGKYRGEFIEDIFCDSLLINSEEQLPLQIAGESCGRHSKVEISYSNRKINVVNT